MQNVFRHSPLDQTIGFLRNPYDFISREAKASGRDAFETRIMLQKTICLYGRDAAELFYDPEKFQRKGAVPSPLQATLFDKGGIQGVDGAEHILPKSMFMQLMTPETIEGLGHNLNDWLMIYARRWSEEGQISFYEEMQEVLTQVVCEWVGIPLGQNEVRERTKDLTQLFDRAAAKGPGHFLPGLPRKKAEAWIEEMVKKIRHGQLHPHPRSPASIITWHRGADDRLLSPRVVSVELLNLLRPTVAVAAYAAFCAHALHLHPECRERIARGEPSYLEFFIQEVCRYYPFFPTATAMVRKDFEWRGQRFRRGTRVILDLYGTNHDPRIWKHPNSFWPERFKHWDEEPFILIHQDSSDEFSGYCPPGEWPTLELMKRTTLFLSSSILYEVPEQDLHIDKSRHPSLPNSRMRLTNVTLITRTQSLYVAKEGLALNLI